MSRTEVWVVIRNNNENYEMWTEVIYVASTMEKAIEFLDKQPDKYGVGYDLKPFFLDEI